MKLYRDIRWLKFREEIIELDGHACTKCKRKKEVDGVILQVHHKKYDKDKLPWEYPSSECETLCKGCHAREHGEIRPNEGWNLIYEDDLGSLCGECELCGTSLRYAFFIQHPHWEPMSVGTNCCDYLTGTEEATEYRKKLGRLARFINSPRWQKNYSGIEIKQQSILIEIIAENSKYKIIMNEIIGKQLFKSVEEAKRQIFNVIENGDAQKYLKNRCIKQ